jgi:hypothetical protein
MTVDLPPIIDTPLRRQAHLRSLVPVWVETKELRISAARADAIVRSMLYRPLDWTAYLGDRYARRLTLVERLLLAIVGGRPHG